jgi:predicted nucleic acid-binding protein
MIPPPSPERLARCAHFVGKKDAHVLAAALECGADYLLMLERRHLLTSAVQSVGLPIRMVTPGDFLREVAAHKRY